MKNVLLLASFANLFLFSTFSVAEESFDLVFDHVEVSSDHTDWAHYQIIFENCTVTNMFGPPSSFSSDAIVDEYIEGKKYTFPLDQKIIVSFKPWVNNKDINYLYVNTQNTTLLLNETRCSFRAEEGYWADDVPPNTAITSCMQQFRSNPSMNSCMLKYENKEEGTVTFFVRIDRKNTSSNVADKK